MEQQQERGLAAARERLAQAQENVPEEHRDRKTYKHSDFLYDAQQNAYRNRATGDLVEAAAVNALIPMELWRVPPRPAAARGQPPAPVPPARDICRIESGLVVESSTWLPGRGEILKGIHASKDGMMPVEGVRAYNSYRPPLPVRPELASEAKPWVEHVKKLYPEPEEHEYFFDLVAHMVQRPEQKANSIVILSGAQGIGKDALLHPMRRAVGEWNCANIGPDDVLDKNNPWTACVMLTIDEVRPQQDEHRATAMYDALKALSVTPPYTIAVKEKYEKTKWVVNCMRVFATTNDRLAMFIPEEDRRVLMMHSPLEVKWHTKQGDPEYFERLFEWIEHKNGAEAVAAWLAARDISKFRPAGEVPRTEAWAEVAQRWTAPDDELTQALEMLGNPEIVFSKELTEQLFDGAAELAKMMKGRNFPRRMLMAGYTAVPLPEGQVRWARRGSAGQFRSSKAFVRTDTGIRGEEAYRAVNERLHWCSDTEQTTRARPLQVVKGRAAGGEG